MRGRIKSISQYLLPNNSVNRAMSFGAVSFKRGTRILAKNFVSVFEGCPL